MFSSAPEARWPLDSIPALALKFRYPPELTRAEDQRFSLPDSPRATIRHFASLSFQLDTLSSEEAAPETVTYIDGVPVSPGGRGSHSPQVERRCTIRLGDHEGLLELTHTYGWGDSYGFTLRVPLGNGTELVMYGSADTLSLRDRLLGALQTVRWYRAN